MAVNMLAAMPMIRVTAKPLMGPVPNWNRNTAEMTVVRLESKIVQNAFLKPASMADLGDLPEVEFLADALEDQHVGVHGHADGQDDAGDAGQGQGGVEIGHDAHQDQHVQQQGQHRVDAGGPVVDQHEQHDQQQAAEGGHQPLADGIGAQRGADGPFLDVFQRRRQGARAQHQDDVVHLVDGEAAVDDAVAGDDVLDGGHALDAVVEDDGERLADVGGGEPLELGGPLGIEGEADGRGAVLVLGAAGALQVLAGNDGGGLQHVKALVQAARIGLDDLQVLGQLAVVVLQRRFLGQEGAADHQVELQHGRALDQALDPFGVVDAGKIDQHLVAGQPFLLDGGLGHAEFVDAVADGLQGLVDRLVAQLLLDVGPQRQRDQAAADGIVPVAEIVVEDILDLALVVHERAGDLDLVEPLAHDLVVLDAAVLEQAAQLGGAHVGLDGQGLVGHDLHDQVHAAFQVEPQVDLVLGGI